MPAEATVVPGYVIELLWLILSGLATWVVAWVARTLSRIVRILEEMLPVLIWLRDEHDSDDSKFATGHLAPLLQQNVRLAKSTLATIRWYAENRSGGGAPPTEGDE